MLGSELFPSILQDPYARDALTRLDFDVSQFDQKRDSLAWKFGSLEGILRSRDILFEIEAYLKVHPQAAVVNMGCGLDATPLLADNGSMRLYNIDRQDVIDARNALVPPMERERNLVADLKDAAAWIPEVDASEGVFLFAAGVFMYLKTDEVKDLALALQKAFPQGVLVFDTLGSFGIRTLMKGTLRTMGIEDAEGRFSCEKPERDCLWDDGLHISSRPYLTGYVDLKSAGVQPILRATAHYFDAIMKMRVVRVEL
ncbi:MAG: class I SAM-dependent methyltransferase [Olsenella sp.]|nr:class I SAM-dependent methyltransferase [Olsenella sp.]